MFQDTLVPPKKAWIDFGVVIYTDCLSPPKHELGLILQQLPSGIDPQPHNYHAFISKDIHSDVFVLTPNSSGTVARLDCIVRSPATGPNAIRTGPVWSDHDLAVELGVMKVLGIYFLCRMGFDDPGMKDVLAGKIAEFTLLSELRHSSASWVDDILHQILPSPCYRMPWLQELRSVGTAVALRQLDHYRLDALITIGHLIHEDAITRKDSTVRIYEGRTFRLYGDKEYVGQVVARIRDEDALKLPVGYLHRCFA